MGVLISILENLSKGVGGESSLVGDPQALTPYHYKVYSKGE